MGKKTQEWPEAPCCWPDHPGGCQCPPMERALRAWMDGKEMPAMTPKQREACLEEIRQVEGYDYKEHESETDAELSNTTLSAWTDYCRDKGLM